MFISPGGWIGTIHSFIHREKTGPLCTSNVCWNFCRRSMAAMGSSPGTMGPFASQSRRNERASTAKPAASNSSRFLNQACARQPRNPELEQALDHCHTVSSTHLSSGQPELCRLFPASWYPGRQSRGMPKAVLGMH